MATATKRKPLRAIPQAVLRKAWNEGRTYYPPRHRPKSGYEKPIEVQTLDDLCGGDAAKAEADLRDGKIPTYGEPLSESRRSWLTTGMGILSANMRTLFGEDGESVELIDVAMSDPERNAQMYSWTPYEGVDPNMQIGILYEQTVSQHGDPIAIQIFEAANGVPSIRVVSRWWRKTMTDKQWHRVARTLLREHAAEINRVFNKFSSAYAAEEKWRYEAPADDLWHSAYESYGPVEGAPPGEPWEFKRVVRRANRPIDYEGNSDLWHTRGRDQIERELGMESISDAALEELLGITEWDEDGTPCVSDD